MILLPDRFKMIFKGICLMLTSQWCSQILSPVLHNVMCSGLWRRKERRKRDIDGVGKESIETLPFVQLTVCFICCFTICPYKYQQVLYLILSLKKYIIFKCWILRLFVCLCVFFFVNNDKLLTLPYNLLK